MSADPWPDDLRLSDLEPRFVCTACGKRGADIRPDFRRDKPGGLTVRLCPPAETVASPFDISGWNDRVR
jgi:hypothetical protein